MRVPVYDRQQVAPGTSPTPGLGRAQDSGLGTLGQGIQDLGKAADAVSRAKQAVDTLKLQGALNEYESRVNTEKINLHQMRGVHAAQAFTDGLKSAEELRRELKQGLPSNLQERFDLQAHGTYERFRVSASSYADKQLRGTMQEQAKVRVEMANATAKDPELDFEKVQELANSLWGLDGPLDKEFTAAGATEELRAFSEKSTAQQLHANSIQSKIDAGMFAQAARHVNEAETKGLLTKEAANKFKSDIEKYAFDAQADDVLAMVMEQSRAFSSDGRELKDDEKYVRPEVVDAAISQIPDARLRAAVERKWTGIRNEADSQKTVISSVHYDAIHNQAVRQDGSFLLSRLDRAGQESLEWMRLNDKPTYDRLIERDRKYRDALTKASRAAQRHALAVAAQGDRSTSQYALFNLQRDLMADPESFYIDPSDGPGAVARLLAPYITLGLDNDTDRGNALKAILEVNKPDVATYMKDVKVQVERGVGYYMGNERAALEGRMMQRFFAWRSQAGNADQLPDETTRDKWLADEMLDMGIGVEVSNTGRNVGRFIAVPAGAALGAKIGTVGGPLGAVAGAVAGGGAGWVAGGAVGGWFDGPSTGAAPAAAGGTGAGTSPTRGLHTPLSRHVFIRDPVTNRVDPIRVRAAHIAMQHGIPLTEANFQVLSGQAP